MSILENLNEAWRVFRYGNAEVKVDDSLPSSLQEANYSEICQFINDIRKLTKSREELKAELDEMSFDSIIASAMELLADDATQTDPIRDKTVWITSKDPDISTYLEEFLEAVGIEDNIWTYAYQVVKYGELYLKTYHSEFENGVAPEELKDLRGYVYEREEDPTKISDLEKYGFSVGYAKIDSKVKSKICPPEDYIHFINDRMGKREKVTLTYLNDFDKEKKDEYKVRYGTSAFESARQAWAMLNLIEMLVLYVRFGKSAFYRLFKVEVGGASRNETIRILRETKASFNVQDNIDVNNKTYTGVKKPLPHGENVYLPVRQGKGEVTVEEVGGSVDIKEIADLDYWRNKLFAALKMPKAYLGFEETQPGGLGNVSLTRQDIRYARSVKVIKRVLKNGIIDMIDSHLKETGHEEYIGKYEVEMTQVMSAEVSDIEDEMMSNITLSEALKNLLQGEEGVETAELMKVIVGEILDLADKFPSLFKGDKNGKSGKESS